MVNQDLRDVLVNPELALVRNGDNVKPVILSSDLHVADEVALIVLR
jgi:hypothetical protein